MRARPPSPLRRCCSRRTAPTSSPPTAFAAATSSAAWLRPMWSSGPVSTSTATQRCPWRRAAWRPSGIKRDGTITAIEDHFWNDHGAYTRTHGATVPNNTAGYLPGPYRVPNYYSDVTCVVTNKTPTGTYRGPGRFEANFVRERLMDMA